MTAMWRRLFGRKDELDDSTTAYIEGRASPAEVDAVRREIGESSERGRELEELRQTVALMRSVETPAAPRSFALTPDMVPEQRRYLRLDLSYAPAAAAAVLVLAVGVLIAGDLSGKFRQSESGRTDSMSASPQFAGSERVVRDQYDQAAAEKIVAGQAAGQEATVVEKPVTETLIAETATPAPAMKEKVVETVLVEKGVIRIEKVVETVVVEKPVTHTEKVVETVIVEKPVTITEKVIETVVVEKPVTSTEKVVETVVVEKPVTRTETVVETVTVEKTTAMRAVLESDVATAKKEAPPDETPVVEAAAAAKSMAEEAEQASPTPAAASATLATSVPTVEPTSQPTATLVPTVEPTSQPTATTVPTVEPTTQPTATLAPTVEPTMQPTATLAPSVEPTPRPNPTPILQEEPAAQVEAEARDDSGISLPLWQLEVLLALLVGLMVALWAVLRQRSGRRN